MEASVVLPADICESETGKKIILVAKCLAMNTHHGVEMASYLLLHTKWSVLPYINNQLVVMELSKACFVIAKLAVTFEKINIVDQSR